MTFQQYATQKGVKLLKDDIVFINSKLNGLQKAQKTALMKRYVEIWCNTSVRCKNALKRDNEARREANLFLMRTINARTSHLV